MEHKRRRRKQKKRHRRPRSTAMGWSISQWCKIRGMGRTTFYGLDKKPKVLRPNGPGCWSQITRQADADWAAENSTVPISAEAEAEIASL
jgi:hypothetical protein